MNSTETQGIQETKETQIGQEKQAGQGKQEAKTGQEKQSKKEKKYRELLFLHFNILIFSFTGIFSKLLAGSINVNGIFHWNTVLYLGLMVLNCGIYAIFWQQSIKNFDLQVAYSHRTVYNIWSLLWAFLIFGEKITVGNLIGTALMIAGVLVIQSEKAPGENELRGTVSLEKAEKGGKEE